MATSFPIDMLEYLVCPETHQKLELADAALLERLSATQRGGQLVNRGGQRIDEPFEAALVREDRAYAYLIRDGIPIMLIEEAVALG